MNDNRPDTDAPAGWDKFDGHPGFERLLPVEICVGSCWTKPAEIFHGRFIALPRLGELVEIPQRGVYRTQEIRHVTATPAGARPLIRMLVTEHTPSAPEQRPGGASA